jgi:hypothetical protein
MNLGALGVSIRQRRIYSTAPPVPVATTYYVDPAGSDTNDGTSTSTPWKTLAKVNATKVEPGSTILFKGGSTFSGSLTLASDKHYGVFGNVTKFASYGTGKATIAAATNAGNGCTGVNPTYVQLDNLIFTGTGNTVSTGSGILFTNDLLGGNKLPGVSVTNIEVSGFGKDGIAFYTGDGAYNASSPSGWFNPIIDNCLVHDCSGNATEFFGHGITIQGVYGMLALDAATLNPQVSNCTVYNITGKSTTTNPSGNGIYLSEVSAAVIEHCHVYNCGANTTSYAGATGIGLMEAQDCIVQYCEVHDIKTGTSTVDGNGITIYGGSQNNTIQYCYTHNNQGAGYCLTQWDDAASLKNFVGNVVRYCISENDASTAPTTRGAVTITTYGTSLGSANHVYGNTIYSSVVNGRGLFFREGADRFANTIFANNIWRLTGTGARLIDTLSTTAPAPRMLGNLYSAPSVSIKWGTTTYTNIDTWRAAFTTQETLSGAAKYVSADPLFVGTVPVGNTSGFSATALAAYKTQGTSPARDAGIDLFLQFGINPGSVDLFGDTTPAGTKYDIGCYDGVLVVVGTNYLLYSDGQKIDLFGDQAGHQLITDYPSSTILHDLPLTIAPPDTYKVLGSVTAGDRTFTLAQIIDYLETN